MQSTVNCLSPFDTIRGEFRFENGRPAEGNRAIGLRKMTEAHDELEDRTCEIGLACIVTGGHTPALVSHVRGIGRTVHGSEIPIDLQIVLDGDHAALFSGRPE